MLLKNETTYDTRTLRRFFSAGLAAMGASRFTTVYVRWQKRFRGTRGVHGRAAIDGRWLIMFLPRPMPARERARLEAKFGADHLGLAMYLKQRLLDVNALALVFEHEVAHNLGLGHAEMTEAARYCQGPTPLWAHGFLPEHFSRPEKPKPSREDARAALVAKRHAKAVTDLARWQRKLKLAQTKVRKAKLALAGYERRAAAAKAPA